MIQHDWYLFMVVPIAPTKMFAFFLMKERKGERDTEERDTKTESNTQREVQYFLILHCPIWMLLSYNVQQHMIIFHTEIA
jgi:hypothetical protein